MAVSVVAIAENGDGSVVDEDHHGVIGIRWQWSWVVLVTRMIVSVEVAVIMLLLLLMVVVMVVGGYAGSGGGGCGSGSGGDNVVAVAGCSSDCWGGYSGSGGGGHADGREWEPCGSQGVMGVRVGAMRMMMMLMVTARGRSTALVGVAAMVMMVAVMERRDGMQMDGWDRISCHGRRCWKIRMAVVVEAMMVMMGISSAADNPSRHPNIQTSQAASREDLSPRSTLHHR